ncbi:MAG TPA: HEAT repeat domain-containing protein, partial [Nitrospira sp.]|nr:HEAT repeat domain-containing protein [Nitrospira sp.]
GISHMERTEQNQQHEQDDRIRTPGEAEAADELTDQVAAQFTGEAAKTEEPVEQVLLEEEKVKDEIDIQIDLLKDPDWVVRREAAITLGEMADERCVEPLCKALYDGDWQVREVAIDALGQIGSPAVERLIKLLRDWDVRKYAIAALGKIRDERVLDPLMLQLHNDEFKDDATNALVELGEPALPRLVAALKDKDEMVRKQAVLALGRIKHGEAIDPLIEMLSDKDWFTRLTAAAALEAIGDARGREAIKPLTKDPDMVVRMRVERILAKWKKQPATA